jgi:Flp pilus assembly protein TadD
VAALVAIGLAGCETLSEAPSLQGGTGAAVAATDPETADLTYVPSAEPLRLGFKHFNRGNFGLAEQYFRDAVERSPREPDAWIGLAASYDNIRRFDLADRSYRAAIRLAGETTQILNNQGYSYMLRGDFRTARAKFQKALQREPNNLTIVNNLEILRSKEQTRPRAP